MKLKMFVSIFLFVVVAQGCTTQSVQSQNSKTNVEKIKPVVSQFGYFSNESFSKSKCESGQSSVYFLFDGAVHSVPEKSFMGAQIQGHDSDGKDLAIQNVLQSPNVGQLGCSNFPFPADTVNISFIDQSKRAYNSPFFSVKANQSKADEADRVRHINQVLKKPECVVSSGVLFCPSIELISKNSTKDGNFWYVKPTTDTPKLVSGSPYVARCRDSFSAPACILIDLLTETVSMEVIYFKKDPEGQVAAISLYQQASTIAKEFLATRQ